LKHQEGHIRWGGGRRKGVLTTQRPKTKTDAGSAYAISPRATRTRRAGERDDLVDEEQEEAKGTDEGVDEAEREVQKESCGQVRIWGSENLDDRILMRQRGWESRGNRSFDREMGVGGSGRAGTDCASYVAGAPAGAKTFEGEGVGVKRQALYQIRRERRGREAGKIRSREARSEPRARSGRWHGAPGGRQKQPWRAKRGEGVKWPKAKSRRREARDLCQENVCASISAERRGNTDEAFRTESSRENGCIVKSPKKVKETQVDKARRNWGYYGDHRVTYKEKVKDWD